MTPFLPALISRRRALSSIGAAGLATLAPGVRAQGDKPVKFILPVSAGSGVDAIVRGAAPSLGKALGAPVMVENQPGAGGVVGTQAFTTAPPDGHTLGVVSNNHVIYPSVLKSVPFDPLGDITPITIIATSPMVLVVNPKLPAKDMKELVALLKANPGKYNYASSGNGTILHLAAEMFKGVTGTHITHIPYRGTGPMMADIIGGQIDMGVIAMPAVHGQIKTGALRAICVASAKRSTGAPDVPTAAEQGYPAYLVEGWSAAVGPKGLPAEQVRRIHQAFASAFATPEVREAMDKQGNTIVLSTPEQAQAHFRSELAKYAAIVKRAGVTPQ